MKKIFIAASLLLFIASCNNAPQSNDQAVQPTMSCSSECTMAFVNMERVLTESDIFLKEGLPLQQRSEASQRDWASKEQAIQKEVAQLQQKYQNGLITTANAQKEQQSLETRAREFGERTQKEMRALEEENTVFANRTQKLIMEAVAKINKDKKYKMIVNASALIDADTTLDISTIVLKELNELYKVEKK